MICSSCAQDKALEQFYIHSNGKPRRQCKSCRNSANHLYISTSDKYKVWQKEYQEKNRETLYAATQRWRKRNLSYDAARVAERRASKKQATPSWVNTEELFKIYKNCPTGCHVDHIIPLRGENVSGLHVPWNLQYLTAEENMKKGNRFRDG